MKGLARFREYIIACFHPFSNIHVEISILAAVEKRRIFSTSIGVASYQEMQLGSEKNLPTLI